MISLASSVPRRVPSIKFLGRNRSPCTLLLPPLRSLALTHSTAVTPHGPTAHPAAPQAIIDAFPSFLKKLSASTRANLVPSLPVPSPSHLRSSAVSTTQTVEGEWGLPSYLQRGRYAPTPEEIEAVEVSSVHLPPHPFEPHHVHTPLNENHQSLNIPPPR